MQPAQGRRYRILEVLGSGGFGTVYRAEVLTVTGLRREVALKVLNENAASNEDAAKRLRDEARILSNLNHFGIVRVDDLLQLDGRWTMVMELVRGVDCSRIVRSVGPPPASVSLDIVSGVARTLHAVSKATGPDGSKLALVHRDVKPANILLTEGGAVKLLDFGVARANVESREAETQQAYVMGSLPYLAPERYGFEDTPAGDVYALGCVLYELFVGKRFGRTRPSRRQHRVKLRDGLHDAWESVAPDMREDILPILGEALAYEGEDRPAPRDLATRIEALRHRASGPTLADWAEKVVGELVRAGREVEADSMCGRVLTENLSAESMAGPVDDFVDEHGLLPVTSEPELTIPEMAPLPTDERPKPTAEEVVEELEEDLDEEPAAETAEESPDEPGVGPPEEAGVEPLEEPSAERPSELATAPRPMVEQAETPSRAPMMLLGIGVVVMTLLVGIGLVAWWGQEKAEPEVRPTLQEVMEQVGEDEPRTPEVEFGEVEEGDIVEEIPVALPPDGNPSDSVQDVIEDIEARPAEERPGTGGAVSRPPQESVETSPEEAPATLGRIEIHGDAEFVTLRGPGGSTRVSGGADLPAGTYQLFPSFPGGYTVPGPSVEVKTGETLHLRCSSGNKSCVTE
ncbi:MAG TPA: serine/threonine-protein kinase [Myxococcota bacterium]|nr:serine/threonine-protein kinase [Myxococcota bacterium]